MMMSQRNESQTLNPKMRVSRSYNELLSAVIEDPVVFNSSWQTPNKSKSRSGDMTSKPRSSTSRSRDVSPDMTSKPRSRSRDVSPKPSRSRDVSPKPRRSSGSKLRDDEPSSLSSSSRHRRREVSPKRDHSPRSTMSNLNVSNSNRRQRKKNIHFDDNIVILEFYMIMGDNPGCSSGAPVQLSWKPCTRNKKNFNMYECCRSQDRFATKRQMVLSRERRADILLKAGYSAEEIHETTNQNKLYRAMRKETLKNQGEELLAFALEQEASAGTNTKGKSKSLKGIMKTFSSLPGGAGAAQLLQATGKGMKKVLSAPAMHLSNKSKSGGSSSGNTGKANAAFLPFSTKNSPKSSPKKNMFL